nr:TetR/AcrR family transcriptional regulator [Streptomyces sp. 846.5]
MTNAPAPRSRRSSATVRSLVLRAAAELFEEQGFGSVSTREIAARAGVTQAQVFRHFGTKTDLFVEAVYQPFHAFVTDYVGRWAQRGHGSGSSVRDTEVFVGDLYRLLLDHRGLLAALSGQAGNGSPELPVHASALLQEIFDRLEREVTVEAQAQGRKTIDAAYAVRFAFALVFGVSVLDQALFPDGAARPSQAQVIEEMSGFILRGASIQEP